VHNYPGVGRDRDLLREYYDSIEYALDALRADRWALDGTGDKKTLADIHACINDIETRLQPRLQGLVNALIRAHHMAGGSIGQVANAMDKSRSTAQYRSEQVLRNEPGTWEQWARGDLVGQEYLHSLRDDPDRSKGYVTEPEDDNSP
jgi:hypothetical protein